MTYMISNSWNAACNISKVAWIHEFAWLNMLHPFQELNCCTLYMFHTQFILKSWSWKLLIPTKCWLWIPSSTVSSPEDINLSLLYGNLNSHSGIYFYQTEYMICFSTRSAWPVKQLSESEQCEILNFGTAVPCQINRFFQIVCGS